MPSMNLLPGSRRGVVATSTGAGLSQPKRGLEYASRRLVESSRQTAVRGNCTTAPRPMIASDLHASRLFLLPPPPVELGGRGRTRGSVAGKGLRFASGPLLLGLLLGLLSAAACGGLDAGPKAANTDTAPVSEGSSGSGLPLDDTSSSSTDAPDEDTGAMQGSSSSGAASSTGTAEGTSSSGSSTGGPMLACASVRIMVAPGAGLNLRSDASTTQDPVGTLNNADVVDVLEEVDGQPVEGNPTWLHIVSADQQGYIAQAHTSCAVEECDLFEVPPADYLSYGLHPDASDALVYLGITPDRITQTIGGAAASAGTHAQDGTADGTPYSAATDLRVLGLSEAAIRQYIIDLAAAGYAGWYREPGADGVPSDWSPHIHTVWVGAPMKASLRNQIRSWMEGRNGLVSNTPYGFHQWPPCVRDALWERYLELNPADG